MLQKILVVIVGLIMSVVGALSPAGLLAGKNQGSDGDGLAANTAEETLATLRTSDGEAFARVSVLWVEVDGRRVSEDAWGTGEVDEIRFKVGVKDVDGVALAVGDKVVPLHPTDIITIRMFRGDFSYRGMGGTLQSVQLQGTVKTTVLNEGDVSNRVITRVNDLELRGKEPSPGDQSKVAYVVLTTGQKVDTVAVEDGGARLYTEEVATASEAKNEPGNLLAKWVKVDGKLIREYTWGDGALPKVEFEPAEGASRSIVLAFNGETFEVAANERVVVEDFVGEYLIYQVSGGMMRLRLDGYARAYVTAPALPTPQQGGEGAPLVSFDYSPAGPKTTDTVQFRDRSSDDGIVVFRQWDFGDNSSGVIPEPTHRFTRPGTYEVTLSVTDNDLKTSNITRTVIVRNAEPIADFGFSPTVVNTGTIVAFTDRSYDPDGTLVNWSWDFGDGGQAFARHPTHRFTRAGNVTVTLTVSDELGARTSLSKIVVVRNAPPLASFSYAPGAPLTLDPVQFLDNSTDRDGHIASWNWSFGDGRFGAGSAPVHAYARPGIYVVSLMVRDDMGDADTASTTIVVGNRPPFAEFTWSPNDAPAGQPITFTSQSSDPDGLILFTRWNFGDGTAEASGPIVSHTFPRAGIYNVTLTATDNTLGVSSVTRSVSVANAAPRASMIFAPNPTYRGVTVTFSDTSTDPDGDEIVNSTWELGDGAVAFGRVVQHTYSTLSSHEIRLTVRDENGHSSTVSRQLRVLNRPPTISMDIAPERIHAGENVTFTAAGVDPDLPGGPVAFQWIFSDGQSFSGPTVVRSFPRGAVSVTLRGTDSEGGMSAPIVTALDVEFAKPIALFEWDPAVPAKNQLVNFTDRSVSANGPIRDWRWSFGDNTGTATVPNPSHAYAANGNYTVRLEVTDITGQVGVAELPLFVNLVPRASFVAPTEALQLDEPVDFIDESSDPDGRIDNWTWEFGDGTTLYVRHATHPGFLTPGAYPVTLTVRDNHGATNKTTRHVNVANSPPIALWSDNTGGAPTVIDETVHFYGYDLSYDPDGNPLTNWTWNFGDGSPQVGTPNASHAFAHSGRFTVGLTVHDGLRGSERTPESHKLVHVEPDHDVTFVVSARLPDGTPAPISLSPYGVGVRIMGAPLESWFYTPVGHSVQAVATPDRWVHGDVAQVFVTAPFLIVPSTQTVTLRDDLHVVYVNFTLRMAVLAQLTPAPGERISALALLGAQSDYRGDPLYTDMLERPHGTGKIHYADLTPAGGKRVDVEARWVPMRYLRDLRNGSEFTSASVALPNWCKVASVTSAANGTFPWEFDGESQCYSNSPGEGLYPVGRWEVRLRPQVETAENRVSAIRAFYVDPTGGLILGISQGLA